MLKWRLFPLVTARIGFPARRNDCRGVPCERVQQKRIERDGALCARQKATRDGGSQLFRAPPS